jgi:hypothetical protein
MSKPKLQAQMRSLSFDEKIKILEKLRDRSLAIAESGLRRRVGGEKNAPREGKDKGVKE